MILILDEEARIAISRHGEATYPEECCGFLVGRDEGPRRVVVRLSPVANERVDTRTRRYVISPETYLEAETEAAREGLDLVGVYHSHPDAPARPSDYDREHALPGFSYVILAVSGGKAAGMGSFRLLDDRSRFDEEPIRVEPAREGERTT